MQLLWKQNRYADNNAKYNDGRQIKRQRLHDGFIEKSPSSQQYNPAPSSLAPLQTDAVALPPTEFQSLSHVRDASILTTTQSKGRVIIPFHILLHSSGKTRQSFWEEGRFGSKSLEEFLPSFAEKLKCAPDDIERIKLVLRLRTREVEFEMEARSEEIWEMMKDAFRDEIERAKAKGEAKGVNVLVEPVMRKSDQEPGHWDEEDEEFDL